MERQVAVRELNQRTSAVLNEVAQGVAITITSGGRPIARLVPISRPSPALDNLVMGGRAIAPIVAAGVPMPAVYGDEQVNVAEALARDRVNERW